MDTETLKALQGSIEKWEGIVSGNGIDEGPDNCPLCLRFNSLVNEGILPADSCKGCPVYERTGVRFCEGSPYAEFEDAERGDDDFDQLARAELDFLKSLLPTPPTV